MTDTSGDTGSAAAKSATPTSNGGRAEDLIRAINDIARLGIDATVPLPKIVVVGDRSAGKSSLIEAITKIRVPRDAGTCTQVSSARLAMTQGEC
jgi:GTP-binding protein EngB required for normal cell division